MPAALPHAPVFFLDLWLLLLLCSDEIDGDTRPSNYPRVDALQVPKLALLVGGVVVVCRHVKVDDVATFGTSMPRDSTLLVMRYSLFTEFLHRLVS